MKKAIIIIVSVAAAGGIGYYLYKKWAVSNELKKSAASVGLSVDDAQAAYYNSQKKS